MFNSGVSAIVPGEPLAGEQRFRQLRNVSCPASEAGHLLLVNGVTVNQTTQTDGRGSDAGAASVKVLPSVDVERWARIDSASRYLR